MQNEFFESFLNAQKDNLRKASEHYGVTPMVVANQLRKYFRVHKHKDGSVKRVSIHFYDKPSNITFKHLLCKRQFS